MNWNDLLKKYFVETLEFVKSTAPDVKNQAVACMKCKIYNVLDELKGWGEVYDT